MGHEQTDRPGDAKQPQDLFTTGVASPPKRNAREKNSGMARRSLPAKTSGPGGGGSCRAGL